jgi:hypothetical protein
VETAARDDASVAECSFPLRLSSKKGLYINGFPCLEFYSFSPLLFSKLAAFVEA